MHRKVPLGREVSATRRHVTSLHRPELPLQVALLLSWRSYVQVWRGGGGEGKAKWEPWLLHFFPCSPLPGDCNVKSIQGTERTHWRRSLCVFMRISGHCQELRVAERGDKARFGQLLNVV
jgi:hypothetical protein